MKPTHNKLLLIGLLLAAAVAACTTDENISSDNKVAVQISASTITRAVNNNEWGKGDAIGITMLKEQTNETIAPYSNYSYQTKDGSANFTPVTAEQTIYFPLDGSKVSFKAYYPYMENLPADMVMPLDVKDQSNQPALDLMTAEHLAGTSKSDPAVKLHFYHRLAKIILDLTTDGSANISLEGCKLVVKGLNTTGSYDIMAETLTPAEDSKADIAINITNGQGEGIILPRKAGEGVTFEITTANGHVYTAVLDSDVDFKSGYKHTLHIRLQETPATVSATIEQWLEEEHTFDYVHVGSANLDANGGDLEDGDRLYLYTGTDAERTPVDGNYTYNKATDSWTYSGDPTHPLLWENLPNTGNIYSSITRPAVSVPGEGNTYNQLPDYITATPIANNGGTDNTSLNFKMKHQVAKVIVILKSTTYTLDELKGATVILPAYITGATMDKGVFVPGNTKADINLPSLNKNTENTFVADSAYLQPQDIAANTTLVEVTLKDGKGNDRTYEPQEDAVVKYEAGKATTLIVNIEKTGILVSASVNPWDKGTEVEFEGMFFTVATGSATGFNNNDEIPFYTLDNDNKVSGSNAGIYTEDAVKGNKIELNTPWYRDDFNKGDKIFAVFPSNAATNAIAIGAADFSWTCNGANGKGNDLLAASTTVGDNADTSLPFKHVLSQVTVNVFAGDGFTDAELSSSKISIQLNGFKPDGTISLSDGTATVDAGSIATGFTPTEITPQTVGEGSGAKQAASSYQAIVIPQTLAQSITVATVTIEGKEFSAVLPSALEVLPGKENIINITLKKTGIEFSASVAGWDNGNSGDITIE